MDPKELSVGEYDYQLPEEKIALYPLEHRDASRLLIYRNREITEERFSHLANLLPENTVLIFNKSKVIEARILFQKDSGGVIEIFCLEPLHLDGPIMSSLLKKEKVVWQCLVGGASKWKRGQVMKKRLHIGKDEIILSCTIAGKTEGNFLIEFSWSPGDHTFLEIIHSSGAMPLPPYIKRSADVNDHDRYQTIYAKEEGSVAAPTAGLHFTNEVFKELNKKNIQSSYITLHVGAGTFKPVKTGTIGEHEMHGEYMEVDIETVELLMKAEGPVVAVGTTSLRTIESLYWLGCQVAHNPGIAEENLFVSQWEPYTGKVNLSVKESLSALIDWMRSNHMNKFFAKTHIIIVPGYSPTIAGGLITNFHQPRSTLLLLVAAFLGNDWKKVYEYALVNGFRFLSYGDASLLWFPAIRTGEEAIQQ